MIYTEDHLRSFTYVLWWPEQNKQYYGVRFAKGCKTTDLGNKYFSSSKFVKAFWKEHGRPVIIIDQQFIDRNDGMDYEIEILKEVNAAQNEDWLNRTNSKGIPVAAGEKNPFYGKKHTTETKVKFKNRNYDYMTADKSRYYNSTRNVYRHAATGETFIGTQNEFWRKYDLSHSKVSLITSGKRNHHKGWTYHGIHQSD